MIILKYFVMKDLYFWKLLQKSFIWEYGERLIINLILEHKKWMLRNICTNLVKKIIISAKFISNY